MRRITDSASVFGRFGLIFQYSVFTEADPMIRPNTESHNSKSKFLPSPVFHLAELRNNDNKISGIPYMLDVSCDVRLFMPDLRRL